MRKKKRARSAAHTSLGRSNAWKLCADAHYPTGPNRAKPFHTNVCPTTLALYLRPLGRRSLKPESHKGLEPTISLGTYSPRTSKLCPTLLLDLWDVLPTTPVLSVSFPKCFLCGLNHGIHLPCLWPPSLPTAGLPSDSHLVFWAPAALLIPL